MQKQCINIMCTQHWEQKHNSSKPGAVSKAKFIDFNEVKSKLTKNMSKIKICFRVCK